MARLTWENVTAPSLSGVSEAVVAGAQLMGKGFSSIGEGFGGIRDRFVDKNSKEAIAAAMGITDPTELDAILSSGGFQQAFGGINPADVSEDAMKMLAGYRSNLLANEQTKAGTAETVANTGRIKAQIGFDQDANSRANAAENREATEWGFNFPRTVAAAEQGDLLELEKQKGSVYADKLAQDVTLFSPEEAKRAVLNDAALSDTAREAALAEIETRSGQGLWGATPEASSLVDNYPQFAQVNDSLASHKTLMDATTAADPGLSLWTNAKKAYGSEDNAKVALLDFYKEVGTKQTNGDEDGAVSSSANDLSIAFDKLKKRFPGMPDSVIAYTLQQSIGDGTNWAIFDWDKVAPSIADAEMKLALIDTPEKRANLERQANEMLEIDRQRGSLQERYQGLANKLKVAISRGASEEVRSGILAEMSEVEKEIGSFKEQYKAVPSLDGDEPGKPGNPETSGVPVSDAEVKKAAENWNWAGANMRPGLSGPVATPPMPTVPNEASELERSILESIRNGGVRIPLTSENLAPMDRGNRPAGMWSDLPYRPTR